MGNGEIKTQFTSKADGKCVHTTCIMCVTKETTQQIQLNAGPNTITVKTTTQDGWYHQDAYFRVRFQEASCDADCSVCEITTVPGSSVPASSAPSPSPTETVIICPAVYDPVCCDTKEYSNQCVAGGKGFGPQDCTQGVCGDGPTASPVKLIKNIKPTVDDVRFPPIGPAECPYDILLLKHNGVTTYPENSIRILSQDETTVTVELLQLFTPAPTDVPEFAISAGATCESGYSPITSNWEDCKAAAVALGFSGDSVGFVDYMTQEFNFFGDRPQGCFKSKDGGRVHFNNGPGASGLDGDSIICSDSVAGVVDSVDYIFYQYNANVFNNKCYEEDNVVGGESITEITIQCTRTSQVAFLELWIADDSTKGVLDEEGDTAVIPNCCYPDAVPKGTPVTFYNIEIKCISQCQGQIY